MIKAHRMPHQDYFELAESIALKLGDEDSSTAELDLAAQQLRGLISAMLVCESFVSGAKRIARLHVVIEQIAFAARSLLDLGDGGYHLADLKMKLGIVCNLMGSFDDLASSDALAIVDKVVLIKAAEGLIRPALRVVARLTDPERVGYVCDMAIGVGSSAMSIAWRASAIVADKGRELRNSRTIIN